MFGNTSLMNRFSKGHALSRKSRAVDKQDRATASALRHAAQTRVSKKGRHIEASQEEVQLRERVQGVFEELGGECDRLARSLFSDALEALAIEDARDDLAPEAPEFAELHGPSSGAAGKVAELAAKEAGGVVAPLSVEEVGAYYKRFETWASSRKLLREYAVDVSATNLELTGATDRVVLAACTHCDALTVISVRHGKLRNSTLNTIAQKCKSQLAELDLSGTKGFDDLGVKSLAVYCEGLTALRLLDCKVTDEGERRLLLLLLL